MLYIARDLNVLQFLPQGLLEKNGLKSLIMRAGRHIVSGKGL